MYAAGAALPSWVMLEHFVFRRDGDESFPDETKAPVTASGTTSWGAPFTIAFSLADPPLASRLYAQLPGFPDPREQTPLHILGTHRHLFLFRVGVQLPPHGAMNQDLFVFSAGKPASCSLIKLPPCTEPYMDRTTSSDGGCLRRRARAPPPSAAPAERRLLAVLSMGLLCCPAGNPDQEEEEEFAVAELMLFKPKPTEIYADICMLRSSTSSAASAGNGDDHQLGSWNSIRVPIIHGGSILCDDTWQTTAVMPFLHWLCYIDYHRGILFCEVFKHPAPTVSFLPFPQLETTSPSSSTPNNGGSRKACSLMYRGVSAVVGDGDDGGRALKFVNVARHDGIGFGEFKPGAGFTITCHTLVLMSGGGGGGGGMAWKEDYKVTADELWAANPAELLPRDILLYPQVNMDRPHVCGAVPDQREFRCVMKKMWVVTIDMNTRRVESFYEYLHGREAAPLGLKTLTSPNTSPGLPCPSASSPVSYSPSSSLLSQGNRSTFNLRG